VLIAPQSNQLYVPDPFVSHPRELFEVFIFRVLVTVIPIANDGFFEILLEIHLFPASAMVNRGGAWFRDERGPPKFRASAPIRLVVDPRTRDVQVQSHVKKIHDAPSQSFG
jgi:hypothetical protein